MKLFDYLIVGSGLFGSVFAHEMTQRRKSCLVIDKRPHTGGNVYCRSRAALQSMSTARTSFIQTMREFGSM